MIKRIFAFVFVTILIITISGIPALAAPYEGSGIKITDKKSIIEAVYFDSGDFYESGGGGSYDCRPEMRDGQGPQTEFGGSGFEGNIGWTAEGEWVQYTINVENAGKYKFEAWLASDASPVGNIEVSYNNKAIGQTESDDRDGWQSYGLYPIGEIEMAAGIGVIKVEFITSGGGTNLAAIEVTRLGAPAAVDPPAEAPAPTAADTPDGDSAAAVPAYDGDSASAKQPEAGDSTKLAAGLLGLSMLLWICIAIFAVLVIVVIVVLVTRKQK